MVKPSTILNFGSSDSDLSDHLSIAELAAFEAAVARGLAQAAAGEVVSGEAVFAWLNSWGTENELPPPSPGRRA